MAPIDSVSAVRGRQSVTSYLRSRMTSLVVPGALFKEQETQNHSPTRSEHRHERTLVGGGVRTERTPSYGSARSLALHDRTS